MQSGIIKCSSHYSSRCRSYAVSVNPLTHVVYVGSNDDTATFISKLRTKMFFNASGSKVGTATFISKLRTKMFFNASRSKVDIKISSRLKE